jgi:hypothetical protein
MRLHEVIMAALILALLIVMQKEKEQPKSPRDSWNCSEYFLPKTGGKYWICLESAAEIAELKRFQKAK